MITKKITTIVFIFAIAAMFVSSNAVASSISAKNSTNSSSKGKIGSSQQDYKDFQKCLSNAVGTKGFATQQEIKNCYNQIFTTFTTSTSTAWTKSG